MYLLLFFWSTATGPLNHYSKIYYFFDIIFIIEITIYSNWTSRQTSSSQNSFKRYDYRPWDDRIHSSCVQW